MFIPVGDEVRKSHFPLATVFLVVAHVFCYFYFRDPNQALAESSVVDICYRWGISSQVILLEKYELLLTYWIFDKSIFSLISTVIVLIIFGPTLENRIGKILFVLCYVSSAMAAGYVYCYTDETGLATIGSVGAAGGLVGAYGVLVGLNTKIRTIFFWGMADLPALVMVGIWLAAQYALSIHKVIDMPISPWNMTVAGVLVGILLGAVCVPLAPNKISVLKGERWIAPNRESVQDINRRSDDPLKELGTSKGLAKGTCCPCCHTDLNNLIQENTDAQFYYCSNPTCKRLVFRTNLVV